MLSCPPSLGARKFFPRSRNLFPTSVFRPCPPPPPPSDSSPSGTTSHVVHSQHVCFSGVVTLRFFFSRRTAAEDLESGQVRLRLGFPPRLRSGFPAGVAYIPAPGVCTMSRSNRPCRLAGMDEESRSSVLLGGSQHRLAIFSCRLHVLLWTNIPFS